MGVRLLLAFFFLVSGTLGGPFTAAQGPGLSNPSQSNPTTLFVHFLDGQDEAVMSTQEPVGEVRFRETVTGASTCLDEAGSVAPPLDMEHHTVWIYGTPSYIEYDFLQNGTPRLYPERGLAYDVVLDEIHPPTFHWYLVAASGLGPDGTTEAPLPVPNVVVRATMREADPVAVGSEAYREGNIIMQGETEPAQLAGPATQGAEYIHAGGLHIYHFEVPLRIESSVIPRSTGYAVAVEVFAENPYCSEEGDYLMPSLVDHYSAKEMRPRLELGVMNPLRIEYLHPQFVGDSLAVHMRVLSPWGNHDLAGGTVTVRQEGEIVFTDNLSFPAPSGHHTQRDALEGQVVFENATRSLERGPIHVELKVWTLQGANATAEVGWSASPADASPDTDLKVPSLSLAANLLALAGLAAALRRQ